MRGRWSAFRSFRWQISKGATHPSPLARRRRSGSHAKNDVHHAFDFTETLRVEVEGDFDVFVVFPGDLEGEACGCELNEPQAVVAGVGIVIEGLDVADAAIIILELTLNKKIGLIGWRQIQVIVAGVLVIERDLEVLAAALSKSCGRPCCSRNAVRPSHARKNSSSLSLSSERVVISTFDRRGRSNAITMFAAAIRVPNGNSSSR